MQAIEANQINWIMEMKGFRINIFRIANCLKMLSIFDKSCLITIKQQICTHINRTLFQDFSTEQRMA